MDNRRHISRPSLRHAFTIIEMLIVIGVIILLLSILVVAMNKAVQAAQSANTQALMNNMVRGVVQFKEDMGYYPPILGHPDPSTSNASPFDRNLWRKLHNTPSTTELQDVPTYKDEIQNWHSIITPAEYLIGYGGHYADGYGRVEDTVANQSEWMDESPPLGIRHPGRDGVWGATAIDQDPFNPAGRFENRNKEGGPGAGNNFYGNEDARSSWDQGPVFGPYIDVTDERLLGCIDGSVDALTGRPRVYFPGDAGFDESYPKVIVDYWGTPIRYYRSVYPRGAIGQGWYQPIQDRDGVGSPGNEAESFPTLADIFLLRPVEIPVGAAVDGLADNNPNIAGGGDTSTTAALVSAQFAFFSAGPDKAFDETVRFDDQDYNMDEINLSNVDNLVEAGP